MVSLPPCLKHVIRQQSACHSIHLLWLQQKMVLWNWSGLRQQGISGAENGEIYNPATRLMTSNQSSEQRDTLDSTELQAAKKAVQSFVSAFKTYTLYPAEHALSRKNMAKLQEDLELFLADYESLRLDMARNAFAYKGELLFEGPAEESNPAYLLTRDGLVFLEFLRGLPQNETAALLNLLNRNRNPFEEPEGDIITALWQENFTHVLYEEVDIFTLESFQFDLSTFRMVPEQTVGTGHPSGPGQHALPPEQTAGAGGEGEPSELSPEAQNMFLSERGMTLLTVTPEEEKILASLVREEEQKDFTSDVIDVLLIILVVQTNKTNFLHALELLEYEFFDTLDKGDFHLSYKLLNNIRLIRNQAEARKGWIPDQLDNFVRTLSGEERFSLVSWVQTPAALRQHTLYLAQLLQVFRLLFPEVIMTLGPLAARLPMESLNVRNELLEIIESKARQDPEPLALLLAMAGEQVNLLLASIVASLVRADAARIYLQMTRHSSPEVRKIGLDSYMQVAERPDLTALGHLLGDDDPRLRERIITYLLQAGPETAEPLLLRFLEQAKQSELQDQKHIFDHYRALTACRAHFILPFLEKTLLESRLTDMFSNSNAVHIKGAALALRTIGTQEALAILKKGGQSMRPDIRLACQHVLKK